MKIYCMRHGQTDYNLRELCNDDPRREVTLTGLGRQQAQQAAEQLRGAALEQIFTSELPRTQQTAAIVNQYHQVTISPHAALNDIRSGFDGLPVADYMAAIAHDPLCARANGGESRLDHKQRIGRFIDRLAQQTPATVLVVAHEETLRAFAAYFDEVSDQEMLALDFANCQIVEYQA